MPKKECKCCKKRAEKKPKTCTNKCCSHGKSLSEYSNTSSDNDSSSDDDDSVCHRRHKCYKRCEIEKKPKSKCLCKKSHEEQPPVPAPAPAPCSKNGGCIIISIN